MNRQRRIEQLRTRLERLPQVNPYHSASVDELLDLAARWRAVEPSTVPAIVERVLSQWRRSTTGQWERV